VPTEHVNGSAEQPYYNASEEDYIKEKLQGLGYID
jgi:hypothetical protein